MPNDVEQYKDNLGIINTKNLTNLRIHRRGYIQYSYDNGENWHNCTDDFLNLYIDHETGDTTIGQIEFGTHFEFPNVGQDNVLYVAKDENIIYRYDTEQKIYVPLNSILDIKVIQSIIE